MMVDPRNSKPPRPAPRSNERQLFLDLDFPPVAFSLVLLHTRVLAIAAGHIGGGQFGELFLAGILGAADQQKRLTMWRAADAFFCYFNVGRVDVDADIAPAHRLGDRKSTR